MVETSFNTAQLPSTLLPHRDTTTAFPIRDPDSSKIPSLSRGPWVTPPQLPGPQHTRAGCPSQAGEGTEGMSQDARS